MDLGSFTAVPFDALSPHQRIPKFNLVKDGVLPFVFDSLIFNDRTTLGFPTMVALYTCRAIGQTVCLKTTGWHENEEADMVDTYNKKLKGSGAMVPARVVHRAQKFQPLDKVVLPVHHNAIAMAYLGITLYQAELPFHQTVEVVIRVARQCMALLKAGLCYTDLKPCNVCVDASLHVSLIDYGSLYVLGATDCTATYPPPAYPYGVDIVGDEHAVVHGLGVLLALSLGASGCSTFIGYEPRLSASKAQASERIKRNISSILAVCHHKRLRGVYFDSMVSPTTIRHFVASLHGLLAHEAVKREPSRAASI